MAEIFDARLTPTKGELVEEWVVGQRWYTGRGRPRLRRLGSWRLDDPAGEVGIETIVFLVEGDALGSHVPRGRRDASKGTPEPVVIQVPLTYRGAPLEGAADGLVGEMEHSVLGHRWVYDAPHDPVYLERLLALLRGRAEAQSGSVSETPDPGVVGHPHPDWGEEPQVASFRVLAGEQSNTSVVITPDEGRSVIMKIFRTLHAGENPDITLPEALGGSPFVPAGVGHVTGGWERADGQGRDTGQLAVAQEFLDGAEDAWRVCLRQAERGTRGTGSEPPGPSFHTLGQAVAGVHTELAAALPTHAPGPEEVAEQVRRMRRRAAAAVGEVPALAAHEPAIRAVLDAAEAATWPRLQRIHGDLHLGQVLEVPGRGWVIIDFEGEPLRPLTERNAPDCTVRDVAGMLRSLDYVAGTVIDTVGAGGRSVAAAEAWREEAVLAFLDGYAEAAPDPRDLPELLTAFVLDKALYEVVYEARHRPTWLHLPTAAVARILEGHP